MEKQDPSGGDRTQSTSRKALEINLDSTKYGTIAEIGAGQETARWFFRVGGAAGTVAKTISAYDMQASDTLYGKSSRYVSRDRLEAMLDREFAFVIEHVAPSRDTDSTFFAFANTVAARNYRGDNYSHGWLGIDFQHEPGAEPSRILIHTNLFESTNEAQQISVGTLGVNLIHAAYHDCGDVDAMVENLIDSLPGERLDVDFIELHGPAFDDADQGTEAVFTLLEKGATDVVVFDEERKAQAAVDHLYKRPIHLKRGGPAEDTRSGPKVLEAIRGQTASDGEKRRPPFSGIDLSLLEVPLGKDDETVDGPRDRWRRLDGTELCAIASRYEKPIELLAWFRRFTDEPICIGMTVAELVYAFDRRHFESLPGGLLEIASSLIGQNATLFIYPMDEAAFREALPDPEDFECKWSIDPGAQVTLSDVEPTGRLKHLFHYLKESNALVCLAESG